MQAQSLRHIKSGKPFEKLFSKAKFAVINLPKSDVYGTLDYMKQLVKQVYPQTKKLAKLIPTTDLNTTCRFIFKFIYEHIQYKPDDKGVEQLRTPNRAWADRKKGVDCDCYSITISGILTMLKIPHAFRMTKYNGKSNFQHVYVIVPKDGKTIGGRSTYYVIDPVLDTYNQEKPFSEKYDKMMKIPHQVLNGVADNPQIPFGQEYDYLSGLGSVEDSFLTSTKAHLENTLAQLKRNTKAFASVVDPEIFKEQLEYVLENWNDPVAREGALEEMAEMEELGENEAETVVEENESLDGLGRTFGSPLLVRKRSAKISIQGARKKVKLLRHRRKTQRRVIPATIERGTLKTNKSFKTVCNCHTVNGLNGYFNGSLGALGRRKRRGFFKRVFSGVKKTVKKVGSTVKKVAKKTVEVAKKVGKAIVRYNPLTLAARGGLLLVMKLNLFGIAKKVKYGYLTEAQARAKNLNIHEWRKIRDTIGKMEKLFTTVGGKAENLRNAILKGKAGGLNGLGAVVTGASTAAASSLVATIVAWLKKIDFKKVYNVGEKVVNTAKQVHQTFQKPKVATQQSPVPYIPQTPQTPQEPMPSYTLPEYTVTATREKTIEKDPPKKSGTGLMIGLIGAGILGAVLLGKKKGLNGVVESLSI